MELSVAAIFCAMMPLLPMPVTTTRPFDSPQWRIISTARCERLGHGPFEARGKGFERGGLGADQRGRAESIGFTIVGLGLVIGF